MALTSIFHSLVLLGVFPYDMVWGGRLETHAEMVMFERVSLVINLFFLFIALLRANILKLPVSDKLIRAILWFMAGLFLLNTVGNLLSQSLLETLIFTPITLFSTYICTRLAKG